MNTGNGSGNGSGILDDLLDQDISEIEDLPTYEVPPKGLYKLDITKAEQKTVTISGDREAPVLDIGYSVVEAVELSDETQREKVKEKMEFNETYFFHSDPEKTKSAIKGAFQEFAAAMGLKTLGQTVKALPGARVYATVDHRKDKNDKERIYARVSNVRPV